MKRKLIGAGRALLLCVLAAVLLSGCGASSDSAARPGDAAGSHPESDAGSSGETAGTPAAGSAQEPAAEDTSPLYRLTVTPIGDILPDFAYFGSFDDHAAHITEVSSPINFTQNYTYNGWARVVSLDEEQYALPARRYLDEAGRLSDFLPSDMVLVAHANGYYLFQGVSALDPDQHIEIWDEDGNITYSNKGHPEIYPGVIFLNQLRWQCDYLIAEDLLPYWNTDTDECGFIRCSDGAVLTLDSQYTLGPVQVPAGDCSRHMHSEMYFSEGLCPVMYRSLENCTHFHVVHQQWDYEGHLAGFVDPDLNLVIDFSQLPQFKDYYINAASSFINGESLISGRLKSATVRETRENAAKPYGYISVCWRIDQQGNILETYNVDSDVYFDMQYNYVRGYPLDTTADDRLAANGPVPISDSEFLCTDRLELAPGLYLQQPQSGKDGFAVFDDYWATEIVDLYGNRYDPGLGADRIIYTQLDNGLMLAYVCGDDENMGAIPIPYHENRQNCYLIKIDPVDEARTAALPAANGFAFCRPQEGACHAPYGLESFGADTIILSLAELHLTHSGATPPEGLAIREITVENSSASLTIPWDPEKPLDQIFYGPDGDDLRVIYTYTDENGGEITRAHPVERFFGPDTRCFFADINAATCGGDEILS